MRKLWKTNIFFPLAAVAASFFQTVQKAMFLRRLESFYPGLAAPKQPYGGD
jgi:hypothetical protein